MAASALIFDLDGTVWDSAGWFASALCGGDAPSTAAARVRLISGGNIIGELKQTGMTREHLLREAEGSGGPPPLFDGMADALRALKERGTILAVATSLPGSIALPMLTMAGLSDTFRAVVHAGLCRTSKPHPASITMALKMIGQAPSPEVFYIGDRATDAEAAQRAAVSSAWVKHGYEYPVAGAGTRAVTSAELVAL